MRSVICALALLALPTSAFAGDFDILRGPVSVDWSGFYAGGQIGADFDRADFTSVATPYINTISTLDANFNGIPLNQFPRLGSLNTTKASYGFYVGYNWQSDSAVVGLELNANMSSMSASTSDIQIHDYALTVSQVMYDEQYKVTTNAAASIRDYATMRGRFGYAVGQFLPYAFGGLSIAQVNASSSVDVSYGTAPGTAPSIPPGVTPPPHAPGADWNLSDNNDGKYYFGFDAGVGLQWLLIPHVFLRGELEYIHFGSPDAIRLNAASARAGAGVQF
jgi:opacity protein-like surface antigen